MNRGLLLGATLLLGASSLSAQAVLTPDPVLSREKQIVNDAIYQLRDTLLTVDAAGARFVRDRAHASEATLSSRARRMAERCRVAVGMADTTAAAIVAGAIPSPDPKAARPRFEKSISDLRSKLVWCDGEFTRLSDSTRSAELRDYGIGRAAQVNTAVNSYVSEATIYLKSALDLRYRPSIRNAGAVPTSPTKRP